MRGIRFLFAGSESVKESERTEIPGKMSQPAVIRALPMFTKDGASKKINLVREIIIGLTIGITGGLTWQVGYISRVSSL